jgi:spore germination protein GerM
MRRLAASSPSTLPSATRVLSALPRGDVLVVDFSGDFVSGYPTGGAAAENLIIASIVYTATGSFPEIRAVQIFVEASTQFDLSQPISRQDLPDDLVAEK